MVDGIELRSRLLALDRPRGSVRRDLAIGNYAIRMEGLDESLDAELGARWGGFWSPPGDAVPDYTIRLFAGGVGPGLLSATPGENYRIEALNDAERRVLVSYHFALCAEDGFAAWRLAIVDEPDEPLGRILDNTARYFAARIAADRGGFAMHAAGVMRNGRAFVFAGPSRAGKTTAVSLSAPDRSLGDDFAIALPGDNGWRAPALPFDNSERCDPSSSAATYPMAGIWRLHQAEAVRVERPAASVATASLMSCTAFPWVIPELVEALLEHVRDYVETGGFAHLHFTPNDDLWPWIST